MPTSIIVCFKLGAGRRVPERTVSFFGALRRKGPFDESEYRVAHIVEQTGAAMPFNYNL